MKKTIKKFWGIALVVVMLSTLFIVATPAAAADPLKWNMEVGAPMGIPGIVYTQYAGTDIVDFAVSADGMTFYVALDVGGGNFKLMKGTFGGAVWSDLTSATNNRLRTTNLFWDNGTPAVNTDDISVVQFVAISPDNPDVVIVAGIGPVTATWQAAASKDGGLNFADMGTIQGWGVDPIANAYDLDVSPISSGNVYYVAIAGDSVGGFPAIYYYNFGATVGSWRDAVNDWGVGGVTPLGTPPYTAWGAATIVVTPLDFRAVQFSPNFGSDFTFMAISEDTALGIMWLHIASMASHKWDTDLNMTFYPVNVEDDDDTGIVGVNAASIAMGPDFIGIEEDTVVTWVGASVVGNTNAEAGAIYRIDETADVTEIKDQNGMYSIAYDGTTVVAGSYDTNNVFRIAEPTANQPTAASARSLKKIGVDDTVAPNDMVIVHFAGANVFGAKRGLGGALSKSTDYGNTWNDFTLMDTGNTVIDDIYMLPDGSAWYMAANDAAISSIYRMSAGVTQRVLCIDMGVTAAQFMLRGISSNPNVIYAASKAVTGVNDVYVSSDGGVSRWSRKTTFPGTQIDDMAVESATVVYIANGVMVYKSTNSGSLWSEGIDTKLSGGIFNMISMGDGKLLAGGNAGGVAFSTDSGATWTPTLGVLTEMVPMYVAGTGLGATDTLFAASSASLNVYKAPAAFFAEFKSMNVPAINQPAGGLADPGSVNSGIKFIDGVLYVLETFEDGDNADKLGPAIPDATWDATYIIHSLAPTLDVHPEVLWGQRYPDNYDAAYAVGALYSMNTVPGSALQYIKSGTSVKLYGIDAGGSLALDLTVPPDGVYDLILPGWPYVYYYEDIVSYNAPTLRGPADGKLFEIISPMLADSESVNFTWDRASSKITSYFLFVSLDETFTEVWFVDLIPSASPAPIVSAIYGRNTFDPGVTYYWKVAAQTPFNGIFSETRSFTIAPSAASVPVIASPANGASLPAGTKPSFSWSPVTGTTKYEFQMDTGTLFTAPMLSEQLATTAIMPSLTLEAGKTYFWRVRALEPVPSEWSSIANFTVAVPEPPAPTPTITVAPTPTFTVNVPPPVTVVLPTTEKTEVSPAYIWAIIIIGAVLVIAVIVLIVRTRRQV